MALQTKISPNTDLVATVRRFGGHASDAALDPTRQIFSIPEIEGFISYHVEYGCAIAFGDPICDSTDRAHLAGAFRKYCKEQNLRSMYITASESFAKWAAVQDQRAIVEFGEEFFIDPFDDPRNKTGVNASLVRRKVRHAKSEHVIINEYRENNPQIEKAMEAVGNAWLTSRKGPQIHTSQIRIFDNRLGKRWFYAEQNKKIIGILILNELQKEQGWLLNRYMMVPEAPGGTPELLVIEAIDRLRLENCHFLSFGVVPALELGEIKGLSPLSSILTHLAFKTARHVFHLDGKRKFWEKFQPQNESSFIVFNQSTISWREIMSLARALNVA